MNIDVMTHLMNNIKTKISVSTIHGVGVFAIKDIKKGEEVFPTWDGPTKIYGIHKSMLHLLPISVKEIIDAYFISNEKDYILIRLFNGINFISHSLSYCNSAHPNKEMVNIDNDGIAIRDIKAGEEILEWYTQNLNLV
jgi:SET domain-containing protein